MLPSRRWCSTPTFSTWWPSSCGRSWSNDDELALDAMREVGPGGHFFGCAHTQARYRTAFFAPDDLGLAQLRELAGGGLADGLRYREPSLQAAARRLRGAADGSGHSRGTRSLRRPPQGRGRRAHRFLTKTRGVAMKSHAQAVVIGGGVVGARVLYHLTKAGWKDVLLIERRSSPPAPPGTRPGACTRSTATPTSPSCSNTRSTSTRRSRRSPASPAAFT